MAKPKFRCYQCDENDCKVPVNQLRSFCENAIYCWKSTLRDEDGSEKNARGCILKIEDVQLVCRSSLQMIDNTYRTACCTEDLCNNGTFPILDAPQKLIDANQNTGSNKLTLIIVVPLLTIGLIIIVGLYYYHCFSESSLLPKRDKLDMSLRKGRHKEITEPDASDVPDSVIVASNSHCNLPELKIAAVNNSIIQAHLNDENWTKDSGLIRPSLVQGVLTKEISLIESLKEEGGFAKSFEVWRGTWLGKTVAVKIYPSRLEPMWSHETKVYKKLLLMKHDNILGYVGSDTINVANCKQLWLVTHYHPNGSLRNHLRHTVLNQNKMLKACLSLTRGLLHLHTETVNGAKTKSSMAHRNLNSTNVFVKSDGTCVIGGFEHAVTHDNLDEANFFEHASKQYMSPELLNPAFEDEIWSLESFQQADVYSLSLIIWEICRRYTSKNEVELDYEIPFSKLLKNDEREPTVEEMRKLIVADRQRPGIPDHWNSDPIMTEIGATIEKCWNTKAASRPSIVEVKKIFVKLANN